MLNNNYLSLINIKVKTSLSENFFIEHDIECSILGGGTFYTLCHAGC